jgi:hypothetical protein
MMIVLNCVISLRNCLTLKLVPFFLFKFIVVVVVVVVTVVVAVVVVVAAC